MAGGRKSSSEPGQVASSKGLAALSLKEIKTWFASNKLILIHPSNRHQNLLIAALIDAPPCELFYYDVGLDDTNLLQFLTGLCRSLADQVTAFDSQLKHALSRGATEPRILAEVFARDLEQLHPEDYLLILDDYDRADPVEDIEIFVEHLLGVLPPKCHLLVMGRVQPRLPWLALVARNQAIVLRETGSLPSRLYSEHYDSHA